MLHHIFGQVKAVGFRHADIRYNNIYRILFQFFNGFQTVTGGVLDNAVNGFPVHHLGKSFSYGGFVIHDHQVKYHNVFPPYS